MQILNAENTSKILDKFSSCLAYQCFYEPSSLPFSSVSEGCEAFTGYTAEELTSGSFCFMDIIHPNDIENVKLRHESTLSIGAPVEVSFRIKTKNGTEKRVLSRSRVAKTDEKGMPYIIEGFFTDITKEFQIAALSSANRENFDFLSKMGYEVRTPMNAILGLAEISLRQDLPKTVREYTHLIKKSGQKLMSALDNIMDYKNIEIGNLKVIKEEYSFAALIDDVANTVKEQLENLEFHVFIDSKIPNRLIGDVIKVRQILQRLLSNAVKFTETGFVSLSVEGAISGETVKLTIMVEDTGRGIKEEDYPNLFTKFSQFDSKTVEGTGLGLAITLALVELMGGTIEAASGYGVGCVFTVTLPQEIGGSKQPMCEIDSLENKNVLILEKNPIYAASIARTLKNLDIKCSIVSTNEDFLYQISQERYAEEQYSHIFADVSHSCFLHGEFKAANPKSAAKIVLLSSTGEISGCLTLTKPIFCVPVANIFNGTKQDADFARFTAPNACVLVVDDISANFIVASGFLQPYNMQVDFCENGLEAIEAVKLKQYDLILMDHLMPAMAGTEVIQIIRTITDSRTDCANVPILALTANTDHGSKELFRKTGANDFLPKPIDAKELYTAIEKWIPKEKQQPISEPVIVSAPEQTDLTIEGVDIQKGMIATGGKIDAYLRLLKSYCENGNNLIPELKKCAETGDMKNYNIYAHAIAGISRSIGANELSEIARELENAAKAEDFQFVAANNPPFIDKFTTLLDNIDPVIGKVTDKPTEVTTPMNSKTGAKASEKKKVLIIDDTDSYLLMLDEILAGEYETLSSLDGGDGLETAKLTKPDIILLDLVMPGMSGYEVLEALKADNELEHIPVILMSANEEELEGEALGSAGYIQKPFEPAIVKNILKSLGGN